MAAPTINGSESIFADTTTADPKTISLATQTYTAGDYLLFLWGNLTTVVSVAGATDDTYALINEFNNGITGLALYEGTVNGGALDASIAMDLTVGRRGAGGLITISGAAANASQPDAIGADTSGDSDAPSAAGLNTTVNDCLVFAIISAAGSHVLSQLEAATPVGWTVLGSWRTGADQPSNSAMHTVLVAYKTQALAGATGTTTWTGGLGSNIEWCGNQIAIAPAAGGGGGLGKFILTRPA